MFEYITRENERNMIENGYQSVNSLELWDWLSSFEPEEGKGFTYSNCEEINKIFQKMEELPNSPGHSGASFGITMRKLQFIAKNGLDAFKREFY
jgi:hypothetical protein